MYIEEVLKTCRSSAVYTCFTNNFNNLLIKKAKYMLNYNGSLWGWYLAPSVLTFSHSLTEEIVTVRPFLIVYVPGAFTACSRGFCFNSSCSFFA